MVPYKISKLLNDSIVQCLLKKKKKWIEGNNLSSGQYSANKNARFKTLMVRLDLWDYSNAYIVKRRITVEGNNDATTKNKKLIFKNNVPFDHACQKSITHL